MTTLLPFRWHLLELAPIAAVGVAQSMVDRLDEGVYAGALSCGVASTSLVPPGEAVSGRQLLRWADEAQYTAKRSRLRVPVLAGRGRSAIRRAAIVPAVVRPR